MSHYKNHTFEITWLTRPADLQRHPALVEAFFRLYEDPTNFPDPDEREEPRFIIGRIAEGSDDPHTHLMAYELVDPTEARELVGGCIVELYPDSSCGLVTYLFVRQDLRGQKIGALGEKVAESLIQSECGLAGLVRYFAEAYGKRVEAVLFESNNPAETPADTDSMPPAKRLKFFDRMGAKRVDFDYIQPPLGDDKGVVTNLFLLCFPDLTGLNDSIPVTVVMGFVMELAKSLDRNKEFTSLTRYGAENYRHDREALARLGGHQPINPLNPELIGLNAEGRNILREMYGDLVARRETADGVALVTVPGVE